MNTQIIVNRIDELLRERNVSQNALMENADISTTVYQWRRNKSRDATRAPSLRSIEKICNFFDISLSYFFAFDKKEQLSAKQDELMRLTDKMSEREIDALMTIANLIVR